MLVLGILWFWKKKLYVKIILEGMCMKKVYGRGLYYRNLIMLKYLMYIIYIVEKWWRIVLKIKYYIYFVILNYFKCFINLVDY